jgi:hypothetical protein
MNLPTIVSSVVVGLLAGLLGPMVVALIGAMRALLHLGQGVTRLARITRKSTSTYARSGTDTAVIVKMPQGRRHRDGGFEESRPAA